MLDKKVGGGREGPPHLSPKAAYRLYELERAVEEMRASEVGGVVLDLFSANAALRAVRVLGADELDEFLKLAPGAMGEAAVRLLYERRKVPYGMGLRNPRFAKCSE